MATRKRSTYFRVTGLTMNQPDHILEWALKVTINENLSDGERTAIGVVTAILPSCYDSNQERVALVEFRGGVPNFLSELIANPLGDWQMVIDSTDINFDRQFFGFTQLYAPTEPVTAEYMTI